MTNANPVLIERFRGKTIETRHRGSLAIVRSNGDVLISLGDVEEKTFPRSALKPIQGLQLILTGAADEYELTDKEISIGCASHSAEEVHENTIRGWFEKVDLSLDLLECGPPVPSCPNNKIIKDRGIKVPRPIDNNCSGKHANLITVCKKMGFDIRGYTDPEHPVQKMVKEAIEKVSGADLSNVDMAIEGCGIPTFAMSRKELAFAYARFADAKNCLDKDYANAATRIFNAMVAEPYIFGGVGEFDTIMTQELGNVITKQGSQGTQIAIIPSLKLGVALKMDDGVLLAKEAVMGVIFEALGLIPQAKKERIMKNILPPIVNGEGAIVGDTRVSSELSRSLSELKTKI
jgi:L-asparaginase II